MTHAGCRVEIGLQLKPIEGGIHTAKSLFFFLTAALALSGLARYYGQYGFLVATGRKAS